MLKDQRGAIFIELVASCLILIIFFFGCTETIFLIRDKIHLQRVARDGAREAVLVGDVSVGKEKAEDRAKQFFGKNVSKVTPQFELIDEGDTHTVICKVDYKHPVFGNLLGEKEVNLRGHAVYAWKDTPD